MKKAFKLAVLGVLVAIGASVGWLVFGEVRTSEAVHFDESVGMVHHQTERMSMTLADTRTVVDEDIACQDATTRHPDRIQVAFDDHRLMANAGLLLPSTLALHLGLPQLVQEHLDLGDAPGWANTGDKMRTGGLCAGWGRLH